MQNLRLPLHFYQYVSNLISGLTLPTTMPAFTCNMGRKIIRKITRRNEGQTSPFFERLPREIRDEIYTLAYCLPEQYMFRPIAKEEWQIFKCPRRLALFVSSITFSHRTKPIPRLI